MLALEQVLIPTLFILTFTSFNQKSLLDDFDTLVTVTTERGVAVTCKMNFEK